MLVLAQKGGLSYACLQAVPAGEDHGHEMNLRLTSSPHGSRGAKAVAHVILPWVTCQKQVRAVKMLGTS